MTKKYRLFKACNDFSLIQLSNYRVGERTLAEAGVWVGVKTGLYIVNEKIQAKGKLIVENYIYQK